MFGQNSVAAVTPERSADVLRLYPGPLLSDLQRVVRPALSEYVQAGGYKTLRKVVESMSPEEVIYRINASGLRGRGGGGFPAGLKWLQASRNPSLEKYFVCNANNGQPGGFKETFLLESNPHYVIEAMMVAGFAIGAKAVILFLGSRLDREEQLLAQAWKEVRASGLAGPLAGGPDLFVYRSPGGYITGEETAVLELIEGRVGRPRGKPPLPTRQGLFGAPTVINNLETVLHSFYVTKFGPEIFRETGTVDAPGTLLFCLSGAVERPGLYELPLGTPLRDLIFMHGGGGKGGGTIKAILVGGVASSFLGCDALDIPLDYDSLRHAGADLGSGVVIVVPDTTDAVDLTIDVARFYYENSCGKCQPCKDGTGRALRMVERLEELDQRAVDLTKDRPTSRRSRGLKVLQEGGEPAGISYTDLSQGLDKIRDLCEWYKHRGDCHHSTEGARAIQSLIELFCDELEAYRSGRVGQNKEVVL